MVIFFSYFEILQLIFAVNCLEVFNLSLLNVDEIYKVIVNSYLSFKLNFASDYIILKSFFQHLNF